VRPGVRPGPVLLSLTGTPGRRCGARCSLAHSTPSEFSPNIDVHALECRRDVV
jgi:hypothetical protein